MSAFDTLADRLRNFKHTGPSTGIASCPTEAHKHGDRSRGLSVRAVEDRVLIYCHAGCGAGDVVAALGLTLGDLYDKPLGHHFAPSRSSVPARDLLALISHEATVVGLLTLQLRETGQLSEEDRQRLATAASRIGKAQAHAGS